MKASQTDIDLAPQCMDIHEGRSESRGHCFGGQELSNFSRDRSVAAKTRFPPMGVIAGSKMLFIAL